MTESSDATAPALARDLRSLLQSLAAALETPLALLSRDDEQWHFEGEAFPPGHNGARQEQLASMLRERAVAGAPLWEGLTGLILGWARGREWVLLIPGPIEGWRKPTTDATINDARRSLRRLLALHDDRSADRFRRRIYAFSRRLVRETDPQRVHALILRMIARQVRARIGALALYYPEEKALAIVATYGYPSVLVEHLRIQPGEGILGRAYLSAQADVHQANDSRRLRYRTNSYLLVPLLGQQRPTGVLALTDRADGRPFDARDLAEARILAGPGTLALAREGVRRSLSDLQRVAAIDSVTGLFNRRHFETRLRGEVQRATRQQQSLLSVLMVDIDDFKRINDTLGHIEGDRTLRTVAELLRGGVRIFDVCARYGGEEFAILMPGASLETAAQVAERIRRRVHQRFREDPVGVTVSIGVARLAPGHSGEELVGEADRRLGLAKRAGKNSVDASG